MPSPSPFVQTSPAALARLIRQYPLGALITVDAQGLQVEHVPFLFDPGEDGPGVLRAHVARTNALCQGDAHGTQALVVFRGPDAYISPGWYPSKPETHRLVPTWNYEVVQARGTLLLRDDARFVRRVLAQLTREHEAAEPIPWRMGDAPPGHIDALLPHIVGVEIPLDSLQGIAKLGQNREPRDRLGAADALAARGKHAIAQAMREAG